MLTGKKTSDWYSPALMKILRKDCMWQKIRSSELSIKFSTSRYHWLSDYPTFENTFCMSLCIPLPHWSFNFHGTIITEKEDKRKERIHWRFLLFQGNLLLTQKYHRKKGTPKDTYSISPAEVFEQSLSYFTEKWTFNTHITHPYILNEEQVQTAELG